MKKNVGHIDWMILIPVVGIMLLSIAFVYSASASIAEVKFGSADRLFFNHSIRIIASLILIIIFAKMDYHIWKRVGKIGMFVAIALLAIVLFVGAETKGAARWINLGFLTFQPSEFAKFALVLHFAVLLTDKQDYIKDFKKGFLPFMIWIAIVCGLIALQPNFSTMIVIFLIAISMMFIGNTNLLHLAATAGVGIIGAGIYAISAQYRMNRIKAFLGMGEGNSFETATYQLNQALIALGNGGATGVGPGQSRQSHLFLPESYGDFIFSIIGEEYGFIGLFILIAAFALIFWRGMIIARNAPDNFGYFLAIGIIITFAIFVFVNAGVNTGILPTTGVPMPFISYGGTAVLFYGGAIGILLNISAQAGIYPKNAVKPIATEENIGKI